MLRPERVREFRRLLGERVLVLDGAMGTVIQSYKLGEADYRGERFRDWPKDLKGNNDLLVLTRPEVIGEIHRRYLEAGADIIETNTFNSNATSQADYGAEALVRELNLAAAQIARRAADEVAARTGTTAIRGRRARPHEPHRLAVAERQRSRLPQRLVRRARRHLRRGDPRAGRGRRGRDPGRDDLRHAERQGGAVRRAPRARRAGARPAGDDLRHDHRRLGPHAVGPDRRGVLELGAPCAARGDRPQLRARREAAASLRRGTVAHRRCLRLRVPERRPAERVRRVRRDSLRDGRPGARIRGERVRQHRRRLLRHDARPHRAHRRVGRGPAAAPAAGDRAALPAERPRAAQHRPRQPVRQRRRTHQRHGLGEVPPPDRGRRLCRRARSRAPAGRERRAGHRRQHGRGHARLGGRDGAVPEPGRGRAGRRARPRDDRLVEVDGHRGRAQVPAGQGHRQLDQPQGRRAAVPRAGAVAAGLWRRRRRDGVRRAGPGGHGRAQGRDLQALLPAAHRDRRLPGRRHHLRPEHLRRRDRHRAARPLRARFHRGDRADPQGLPARARQRRRQQRLVLVPRQRRRARGDALGVPLPRDSRRA